MGKKKLVRASSGALGKLVFISWMLVGLCVLGSNHLMAQFANGGITGTVEDATGAAVPGAQIKVTNEATGIVITASSSEGGDYHLPPLPPGTYHLTAEKGGFTKYVANGIKVDIATVVTLNIRLEVGSQRQELTVQAAATPIETTNADEGAVVSPMVVTELPIEVGANYGMGQYARDISSFERLVPGATGTNFSHQFNGGLAFNNEVMFDGVPISNFEAQGWTTNFNPPYEAVDEFKVLTSAFSAQYGNGQGVVSYHLTSGGNDLHGTGFEYLRNNVLDSRSFFAATTAINRQNEYGGAIGGPVFIPKVYDGRKRTFFYFSLDRFAFRGSTNTSLGTVPTVAMRTGDFSGFVDANGNQIPIYDPVTRTQFPGNIIPTSRFSGVSSALLPLIPEPDRAGVVNNLGLTYSIPVDSQAWSYKIDHNLTSTQRISFAEWNVLRTTLAVSSGFGGALVTGPLSGIYGENGGSHVWQLNYQNTLSSNTVLSLGANGNDQRLNDGPPVMSNTKVAFPGLPMGAGVPYPRMNFSGPVAAPTSFASGYLGDLNNSPAYTLNANLLKTKGAHTLNIGWEFRRPKNNGLVCSGCPATFTFDNLTTSLPRSPDFGTLGSPTASFLLGIADSSSALAGAYRRGARQASTAAYVEDDYKVTSRLTMNLGLRWDAYIPFTEVYNRMSFFSPTIPNPDAGGLLGAMTEAGKCQYCTGKDRIAPIVWHNFAPRVALAYNMNQKTVFRAGYGLTNFIGGANDAGGARFKYNFNNCLYITRSFVSENSGVTPGYGSWDVPYPGYAPLGVTPGCANGQTVSFYDPNGSRAPYIQSWNAGIERQLPSGILLAVTYVGNHGIRLAGGLENLDQLNPKYLSLGSTLSADINSSAAQAAGIALPYPGFSGSVAQALRPYPQFSGINSLTQETSKSSYNALQVRVQKNFTNGLGFLGSYAYSRNYTDSGNGTNFAGFNGPPVNTYNRHAEWSLASATWGAASGDIPHSFTMSGIYELPFGPGKRFLATKSAGPVSKLVGGWQASVILTYQSGQPLAFTASNNLPIFGGGNRPNIVPGVNCEMNRGLAHFDPTVDPIVNIGAFSQPADFTIGNSPFALGNCRSFGSADEDVSLGKNTKLTERVSMEARIEFFNVFNRTVWGSPDTSYAPGNTAFGIISSQTNDPRKGQASIRIRF
jgi:hypothetical protein